MEKFMSAHTEDGTVVTSKSIGGDLRPSGLARTEDLTQLRNKLTSLKMTISQIDINPKLYVRSNSQKSVKCPKGL